MAFGLLLERIQTGSLAKMNASVTLPHMARGSVLAASIAAVAVPATSVLLLQFLQPH